MLVEANPYNPEPKVVITTDEILFCIEYVQKWDAARAHQKVFKSSKTEAVYKGKELLEKDGIAKFIRETLLDNFKRSDVLAQRSIDEASRIAFSNITDVIRWKTNADGETILELKDSKSLELAQQSSIKKVTRNKDGQITLEMHDKTKVLEMMLKSLGMYTDGFKIDADGIQINVINQFEMDKDNPGSVVPVPQRKDPQQTATAHAPSQPLPSKASHASTLHPEPVDDLD
jgi:hypothetical protein